MAATDIPVHFSPIHIISNTRRLQIPKGMKQ
jgi:hypothetical protein